MQLGWSSVRAAGLSHCGKKHHSRDLVMMGVVMLETC